MVLTRLMGKSSLLGLAGMVVMIVMLAACGGGTPSSPSQTTHSVATSIPATSTQAIATASVSSLVGMITQVGEPKVRMLSGANFEVDGQIKNGDTKQHDITLLATLLDASGKATATATKFIDNVPGSATISYAIQGTTTQPGWQSVQVTVIKVSENIGGSGQD